MNTKTKTPKGPKPIPAIFNDKMTNESYHKILTLKDKIPMTDEHIKSADDLMCWSFGSDRSSLINGEAGKILKPQGKLLLLGLTRRDPKTYVDSWHYMSKEILSISFSNGKWYAATGSPKFIQVYNLEQTMTANRFIEVLNQTRVDSETQFGGESVAILWKDEPEVVKYDNDFTAKAAKTRNKTRSMEEARTEIETLIGIIKREHQRTPEQRPYK